MKITDKVAVVTGGAQGIGLGIVKTFLEAGARVLVADREQDRLHAALDGLGDRFKERLQGTQTDVSVEQDVQRMVSEATRIFGTIDILVNNAGYGTMHYVWETSAEEWDGVIGTNLRGTFLCTREAARFMLQQGVRGSIINIASLNSVVPATGMAPYCASKGGVMMLTRVAALELGPRGIRVNAIAPGSTLTPGTEGFFRLPGLEQGFLERTPLGRFGEPRDIGKVALFLASEYSDWMTGQILFVDGGQSLMGLPLYYEGLQKAAAMQTDTP